MRRQIFLLLLFAGGALAFAQMAKPKVIPLSAREAALKKCPLHGTPLKTQNIGISYGLVKFMPGYLEAQKRLFPDANSRVLGGCIVSENSPTMETVKFAPNAARRKSVGWRPIAGQVFADEVTLAAPKIKC